MKSSKSDLEADNICTDIISQLSSSSAGVVLVYFCKKMPMNPFGNFSHGFFILSEKHCRPEEITDKNVKSGVVFFDLPEITVYLRVGKWES